MIAECTIHVKIFGRCHSYFYLVLRPGICDNFPVVDACGEADVGHSRPEHIGLFFQEHMGVVITDDNACPELLSVPRKGLEEGSIRSGG